MTLAHADYHQPRHINRIGFLATLAEYSPLEKFYAGALLTILYQVVVNMVYTVDAAALSSTALTSNVLDGASGDSSRQMLYLAIFCIVAAVKIISTRTIPSIPISSAYNAACIWCLISFLWAIDPAISFRRALGMYIILLAAAWCIQSLGANKTLQTLYLFLVFVISASLISVMLSRIPVFSFAVHSEFERDPTLAGAWRGVMPHKNVAGAVMIHAAMFFFHHAINRKWARDWLFFGLAVFFLLFTKSKTSIGWFALVLMMGMVYRFLVMRKASAVFNIIVIFLLGSLLLLGYANEDSIYLFFSDPENLSGRVGIWQSLLPYIEDHPFLGSGYGSFWAIGYQSPIFHYAREDFVTEIGHSHSGYIEILLTTGIIGFSLAMYALLIVPFLDFARPIFEDARLDAMLFSMWLFGMLQNMTEAQFFSPDKQSWIFVVVAISILESRKVAFRKKRADWLSSTSWMLWPGFRHLRPAILVRPSIHSN